MIRLAALVCLLLPWLAHANEPPAYLAPLLPLLEHEVRDKQLPGLAIAVVDDQRVVWARGFGHADAGKRTPTTPETVFRVGSVSKLFTDLAIMQLVEQNKLDLDAPVTRYLPEFTPKNPFGTPITLRHLMCHRSGLVREPAIGSYFDADPIPLDEVVKSLNSTTLVYPPGEKIKYSNAAIAVVGRVVERVSGQPFPAYLRTKVLEPLGLKRSDFLLRDDLKKDLAAAEMWTYHGRSFPAPTFELGESPAGCMYSTVLDLGRFIAALHRGEPAVRPGTLAQMLTPQFAKPDDKDGFGLGFMVSTHHGQPRIGHGGAIYGFATELAYLPKSKVGVVVIASADCANSVVTELSNVALDCLLAHKEQKPAPKITLPQPIPRERALALHGRYKSGTKHFDLEAVGTRVYFWPGRGGFRVEVRQDGTDLVTDDRLDQGHRLVAKDDGWQIGPDVYTRAVAPPPVDLPAHWNGLIGEYGPDHNILYLLEKEGKLHALIEWFFLYPLKEESPDVYAFPDFGLYHGERLVFTRDATGRATQVVAANVRFSRRRLDGEDGKTFRITPARPVAELRLAAERATPPAPQGELGTPDLVELTALDSTIKLDIRYASTNNFLGTPLYTESRAFLQRPAAEALMRAHRRLGTDGYGILVHDGYRPWSVTKVFWDATPLAQRLFVADPQVGSRHNRGCAVDATLYDRSSGKAVDMVSGYDEFSDRAFPEYVGGTERQRHLRSKLRLALEQEGFTVFAAEWWHFDHHTWKKYPVLNVPFNRISPPK